MLLWLCLAVARAQDEDDETDLDEPVDVAPQRVAPTVDANQLRLYASVEAGPTVPLAGPGAGLLARVALGARLPFAGGRLEPGFGVGWSRVGTDGALTEGETSFSYTADVTALLLEPQLRVRALSAAAPISPEIGLGAALAFETAVVGGEVSGVQTAGAAQTGWVAGWLASAGLCARIGPVEGLVSVAIGARPADRGLAGETSLLSATPLLGVRVLR